MADINFCENVARMVLKNRIQNNNPTEEDIKFAIEEACKLMPMTDNEKLTLEKTLQSSYIVRMDLGESVIREATYHPWVRNRKAKVKEFYYWDRYKKYLLLEQGWDEGVIEKLGEVSDEILDLCGNPEEKDSWKRKGLVLGDVQSGKTSNYLALINKAADYDYKIIILLTGTIEALRKQTQERCDAGFVGLNSRNVLQKNPEKKFVGVGNIDSNRTAVPFTNIISDFNSQKLQALNFTIKNWPEPVIFVLKKNKSVLENLATWIKTRNTSREGEKIDLPLLLIDDEADNASVNTNKIDKAPTTINKAIVEILKLFTHSSYVAVTATPFANIFIDPDLDQGTDEFNLFPSDFIYALSAPTNYIGAEKIFSRRGQYYNSLEVIDDVLIDANLGTYVYRSKAKSGHVVPYLSGSLKKAIRYFLLVNTIMDLKGRNKSHRSMLINVSQFVNVQGQVFDLVKEYLDRFQRKIQSYSKLDYLDAIECEEIQELLNLYDEYELENVIDYSKEEIVASLFESVTPIEVRLVNGKAKEKGVERLDYEPYEENGLRVIAVGGNSLSRGLTLEGLCVSYFDRNSQMYDTLMQMGRWFGYRKGYDELFKIWMESDAIKWYEYISEATKELRSEISEMRRIGLTPKEFGLKVQQNQTSLFVTARNKMRATTTVEQWISLAADVVETPRLIANIDKCLSVNLRITNSLIEQLDKEGVYRKEGDKYNFDSKRLVYKSVPKEIIAKYISSFVSHPKHIPFNAKDLSNYIRECDFPTWTVAVIGGSGDVLENKYFNEALTKHNICYSKRVIVRDDSCLLISGDRARVGVPGATKYGLEKKDITKVDDRYEKGTTVPDKAYLNMDREPVLMIYPLKIDTEKNKKIGVDKKTGKDKIRLIDSNDAAIELIGDYPIIGLGLGFPGIGASESKKVKYVLNRVGEREMLNFEESDDEDVDDENN